MGEAPVLLTSPGIRPYVRSIVERFRPMTVVMSQNRYTEGQDQDRRSGMMGT